MLARLRRRGAARAGARSRFEGGQPLRAAPHIEVPGDFSSAAFFLVAGCLGRRRTALLLRNVGVNPTRTGLLEMLQQMGADIRVHASAAAAGPEPVA